MPRCLDKAQQQMLETALLSPPADGGLWTSPKVAAWISEMLGRPVSAVTGWKYLKRLGFTLRVILFTALFAGVTTCGTALVVGS